VERTAQNMAQSTLQQKNPASTKIGLSSVKVIRRARNELISRSPHNFFYNSPRTRRRGLLNTEAIQIQFIVAVSSLD
jgi:hypothetical protein